MFCPKCGKINPDNEEKCSGCGAVLHEEIAVAAPKGKARGLKIALAIIALLIIVGIVVLLIGGCSTMQLPKEGMSF